MSPYVDNICACVHPFRNHLVAIIAPNRLVLSELAGQLGKSEVSFEALCEDKEIMETVLNSLAEVGQQMALAAKELPVKIRLVNEDWSERDLLTAALKMKRKQVNSFYQQEIMEMFDQIKENE